MKKISTGILLLGLLFTVLPSMAQDKKKETAKCLECHKKVNENPFVHKPSGRSCLTCHESNGKPHPSDKAEGFKLTENLPALCYQCHDDMSEGKSVHPPVKRGFCLDCHEVHSSKNQKLTFAASPEVCFFCHSELEKKADESGHVHSAIREGNSCLTCHSPHMASQPRLLQLKEKELCLQCHDKEIRKDSLRFRNIKKELETSRFIHGAIEKNGCSGCHDPHAATDSKLLKAAFPQGTYVNAKDKQNVALCFKCHDPALLEKKTTTLTSFRNGEQNLHFKHTYKFKGRNCTNCHGIHAGPNQFMLLDEVKFGNWMMPLKFTRTEQGGSCVTACHAVKSYSRTGQ